MKALALSSAIKNENAPVLAAKELAALAKIAVKRTLPKSMLLVQSGMRSESLFFMHSGTAKVFLKDARGKETLLAML